MERITHRIAWIGIIAAVYASLTVSLGALSYSWFQVRLSEALAPLPFLLGFPAVVGVGLGCLLANFASPVGVPDLIFGPLLTALSGLLSWKLSYGKKTLACVYPILINSLGVSIYVSIFYNIPYWMSVLTIGLGEFVSCFVVGYPLLVALEKLRLRIFTDENQ